MKKQHVLRRILIIIIPVLLISAVLAVAFLRPELNDKTVDIEEGIPQQFEIHNQWNIGSFTARINDENVTNSPGEHEVNYGIYFNDIYLYSKTCKITVKDTVPPVITLSGDSNVTLEFGEDYSPQVSAKDNYDGDLTDKIITEGNVDTGVLGSYVVTYSVFDSSNNKSSITQTVDVVDTVKPVITLGRKAETSIKLGGTFKETVSARDNYDGNISSKIIIDGKVDTQNVGTYKLTYVVTDSSGNVSDKVTSTVKVYEEIKTSTGIPVLMYHWFYDDVHGEEQPSYLPHNQMAISLFEKEIKYLAENNYYFCSYEELVAYSQGKKKLPEKTVVITDDDSSESFWKLAYPILKKYKVKATAFVMTNKDNWYSYAKDSYVSIQSHSHNMHQATKNPKTKGILLSMTYEEIKEDLLTSKNMIKSKGGKAVAFAYPYGQYSDDAIQALKDTGFICAFTTKEGRVTKGMNPMLFPRVRMRSTDSLEDFIKKVS